MKFPWLLSNCNLALSDCMSFYMMFGKASFACVYFNVDIK